MNTYDLLEFTCSKISLGTHVVCHTPTASFRCFRLSGNTDHPLYRINKEDRDESVSVESLSDIIVRTRVQTCLNGRTTHMKEIFSPYAIFATIGLSDKKVNTRLRTPCGKGATTAQNVTISAASKRNVNE